MIKKRRGEKDDGKHNKVTICKQKKKKNKKKNQERTA